MKKLPVRPGIGFVSVADVGRAGERRRLQLPDGAVLEPGRGASCRATSKISRLRGLRRVGAGRPLFGLVEPAVLFQRVLRVLSGFEVAQRGPRVRQTRACRAGSGRFAPGRRRFLLPVSPDAAF